MVNVCYGAFLKSETIITASSAHEENIVDRFFDIVEEARLSIIVCRALHHPHENENRRNNTYILIYLFLMPTLSLQ